VVELVAEVDNHLLEELSVARVDHRLLGEDLEAEDRPLYYLGPGSMRSEVVEVAEGSRSMVVVGAADYCLVQNQGPLHCCLGQYLLLLLLLKFSFHSSFL
jgi:hypothetical protein